MLTKSLSVIVPALNEEANLKATVRSVSETVTRYFGDYEILIFNDGSRDRTGEIADQLAASDSKIRVVHHTTPKNLGACYKEGVERATKEFVIMIPGDNECGPAVMTRVFDLAGTADIIIPFTSNAEVRPFARRLISKTFVVLCNFVSGNHLKYYNGAVLHKTHLVQNCGIKTDSFGYQAEILAKLLRKGHSYQEVGTEITYRPHGKSKALRLTNVIRVLNFLADLAIESRRGSR
jgi:dolichol-phosphate mannosyltransferase